MSTNSKIEWTNHTWNPVTGCTKVSQGCKYCYAEKMYERFNGPGSFKNVTIHPDRLRIPLTWRKPAFVFVNSMSDLFHESVPFEFIRNVFARMALTPQHTYQVLTKRPARMLEFFNDLQNPLHHRCAKEKIQAAAFPYILDYNSFEFPLKNVWLMVSVEDQAAADERIPLLLQCPAVVRGLSCEPLLGPLDLVSGRSFSFRNLIHWVIVGGESGSPRPLHPAYVRSVEMQCTAAGVPFFFKQWGNWLPVGQEESAMPNLLTTKATKATKANPKEINGHWYYRLPKAIAGRRLDGKEYNGFPNTDKH